MEDHESVELLNGYRSDVWLLMRSFAAIGNPGSNVGSNSIVLDTKFTVVSMEKLQVRREGTIIGVQNVSGTVRYPKTFQVFLDEVDDGLIIAMGQLWDRLDCFEHILDGAGIAIGFYFRDFFRNAVRHAAGLNHRALWLSLTFALTKREEYDQNNRTHQLMLEKYLNESNGEVDSQVCSVCGIGFSRGEAYTFMPCNDYCHDRCIWSWPSP